MKKIYFSFFAMLIGLVSVVHSQADNPFSAPIFPTPSVVRSADGRPGLSYWQQRADYKIQVSLDTVRRRIDGREVIYYTNNSPLPLNFLWLQLDQNLLKPGSLGSMEYNSPFGRWRG
ncbi:MAG: M1 family peptidase, partial [Candidatus Kryptoniota bacterium]